MKRFGTSPNRSLNLEIYDAESFIALLATIISFCAVVVAVWLPNRQRKFEVTVMRYENLRAKRAMAKALLHEISVIVENAPLKMTDVKIYEGVIDQIGRLDTASIQEVVTFYSLYSFEDERGIERWQVQGQLAIASLEAFLAASHAELDLKRKHLGVRLS